MFSGLPMFLLCVGCVYRVPYFVTKALEPAQQGITVPDGPVQMVKFVRGIMSDIEKLHQSTLT